MSCHVRKPALSAGFQSSKAACVLLVFTATGTHTRRASAWTCCATATTNPSPSSSPWWSSGTRCGTLPRCGPSSGCRGRWRSNQRSWTNSTTTWPGPRLRRDRVGARIGWGGGVHRVGRVHPREDSKLLPCEFDTLRQFVQFKLVHWVALRSEWPGIRLARYQDILAMSLQAWEDRVHNQTSSEVPKRFENQEGFKALWLETYTDLVCFILAFICEFWKFCHEILLVWNTKCY